MSQRDFYKCADAIVKIIPSEYKYVKEYLNKKINSTIYWSPEMKGFHDSECWKMLCYELNMSIPKPTDEFKWCIIIMKLVRDEINCEQALEMAM